MPTSGTTTFTVTRDDIIKAALRSLGVIATNELPSSEDYTNCAFALNLILKTLAADGYLLWCYVNVTVPLTSGTASYTLGPSGATVTTNRPIRLSSAFLRDPDSNDVSVEILSKSDYNMMTPKTQAGIPSSVYYDPTLDKGTLYVWPVIDQTGYNLIVTVQRQVEDIATGTSSTQNFDLPQEWFQPLRWMLAKEVGPEYMVNLPKLQMIEARSNEWEEKIANFTREEASVYFTVNPQQ